MHQIPNTFSSGVVPLLIENTTGETIPPNSIAAVGASASRNPGVMTRSGGVGRFKVPVRKPDSVAVDGKSPALFVITLDLPIKPGKPGYATSSFPAWVEIESGSTYLRGQALAPQAGSWKLHPSEDGLYGLFDIQSTTALVTLLGGSGGGDNGFIFELHSAFTPGVLEVTADIFDLDTEEYIETATIRNSLQIFVGMVANQRGLATKKNGIYFVWQAGCPPEVASP